MSKNFSQEYLFPFLLKEDSYQAANIFGNSQNYDGNNLQAFHLHKHADYQTKMLDFNPKHSENNATFLMGRHF